MLRPSKLLISATTRKKTIQATAVKIANINTTTTTNDKYKNYQYMHDSELPTMYFQRSLPRLPIPKLEQSCERYLNAVRPLLNDVDYDQAKIDVDNFLNNKDIGPKLQQQLLDYDALNKHTSYISQPWFDMYLSDRAALPLNFNPLLVMNNETRIEYKAPMVRLTNLIISSLRFWRTLKNNQLAPEVFHMDPKRTDTALFRRLVRLVPPFATYIAYTMKAYPLDMSQYDKLFGLTRIPQINKDILQHCPQSRHILLLRRGNMYAINVLKDESGDIEEAGKIYGRILKAVQIDEKRCAAEVPLGALTTSQRNKWANIRNSFMADNAQNAQLLQEEINNALFCVCLDTENEENPTNNNDEEISISSIKNLLGGNCHNRWFDKSISLIMSANGTAAVNFEHSWGDGVAVLRYFNEIYKDTLENPFISINTQATMETTNNINVRPLNFIYTDKFKEAVLEAKTTHEKVMSNLDMNILRYKKLHKNLCKIAQLSPDAIMQLSLQLAYYLSYGEFVGSYESCSTAAFRHGRTEALRPCTMATKAMCMELVKPSGKKADNKTLAAMLKNCSSVHSQLTREAAMGQGFDRHLYALKYLAEEQKPKLYESKSYARLNENILSTSTLASPAILLGAFGPVAANGFGIGYAMRNDECGAIISCFAGQRNAKLFIDNLEQSFETLQCIINSQIN